MNEIIFTELKPETKLCGGKYVIEKKLGSGGFGITYLAKHATLEKKYAIKEFFWEAYNVRNSVTNSVGLQGIDSEKYEHYRQRFIEEARTLALLNNDAIVKVIDIFDENGTSYIVMPFVEGVTLQSMIENDGPMEYEMAVNYIVRICDALSYIHSKNILHRDVTPDNIIVTPEQKTVLIDFGSARKFVDNKTQRHTRILKHGYAPLEQYSENSKKGAFTDLYSLGGVLYYILTGVRPIDATERTMEKMKEPIELNPKIPVQMNAIIMKAMAMDSSERYQSASELEDDILSGNFPKITKKTPKKNDPQTTETKTKTKKIFNSVWEKIAIASVFIAIFIYLYAMGSRQGSLEDYNIWENSPNYNFIDSVEVYLPDFSLDSLLNEKRDDIMLRLEDDPSDPAALYAIATKARKFGCKDNDKMIQFWNDILVPAGDVDNYIGGGDISGPRFAFVCAARALDNLEYSNYSIEIQEELRDSLIPFMESLIEKENINSKLIYK